MPVIITSQEKHPFLPSLGTTSAIHYKSALQQDIRPLEIAIVNLMADKQTTERQLAYWLGHTPLQVELTFIATDSYMNAIRNGHKSKTTSVDHIHKFYRGFSEIKNHKYDGLIVTGVNALKDRVEQEAFWPEVQEIMEWSRTNVFSSLYLCWAAKAALKHFHNIDSLKREEKLWGLFEHDLVSDETGLAFGFPDRFAVPVSRWKSPNAKAIRHNKKLEVIADSAEAGPNIIAENKRAEEGGPNFPRRVYILNHPEYDTETLQTEYARDKKTNGGKVKPLHYFPQDNPQQPPINQWRYTGFIYSNWIKLVYAFTPYDRHLIPQATRKGI
ncbi:MAG: homoserine O-succinyltransferase [Proteobacteria bacterium]|jgi:homoserine O-succinyltransferase|nr:homoserine O-succinyltransferase [Alphaproteobacteria bacterium]NCC02711.1 homoserine O-succinyltransferase [Pseudomonadota bacterium]